MTRKHYKAIAEIIAYERAKLANEKDTQANRDNLYRLAQSMGLYFSEDNPRFNYRTFMNEIDPIA